MKQYPAAACAALLLVALTACSPNPPPPTATPSPTMTAIPAPTPTATPAPVDPILSKQAFSKNFTAADGTVVLTVSYTLPDFSNKNDSPALNAISAWYEAEGKELLQAASQRAESAEGDYEISAASGLPFQPTMEEITFTTSYQSNRVICFTREFYANTVGAAHPSVFRMAELFDLKDGHNLVFTDCFTDALSASDHALDAILKSDTMAKLFQQGVQKSDVIAAFQPENFYLTPDGFTFWFQPGDLGPSNSPLEVSVPYSALKEYLVEWIAN